ncbi:MAG TPA: F0F1 ATP synthase subunit delta [Verrucomicrobiae bacterium]|nr:F0F1 ATP synthase subunit delta [Verrucomicrobiae bacterium]
MKISRQAQREARQLYRSCLVNGLLDETRVRRVVTLLAEQKPRGYLEILTRLFRLVKLDREQHSAVVESAAPLSPDLRAEIAARIGRNYGEGVSLSFTENPALLGGMRIRVGSDLYDGSVQTRLEKLKESF